MSEVHELGPMWVKEIIKGTQERRDRLDYSLARLNPDGVYAVQHRMAIEVLDKMLAAAADWPARSSGSHPAIGDEAAK